MSDAMCLTCRDWIGGKDHADMARQGFGRCAHEPRWQFRPPHWTCRRHRNADHDDVQRRIYQLKKRGLIR